MQKRFLVKVSVFITALLIVLHGYYQVIIPKFLYDNDWATTSTFCGFYEMEKNSIDILVLGSSMAASSIIPQQLYNEYGLRCYNLGCEQQNLLTSYYWLREALKYQKPKVVVLESFMFYPQSGATEPLNSFESCTRKAFDYMRWSCNKVEAVRDICKYEEEQSLLGYYLPNIRYHTRWKKLEKNDFAFKEMVKNTQLKGFAPLYNCVNQEYVPFQEDYEAQAEPMLVIMKEYMDKIVELCREKKIEILVYGNPGTKTVNRHNEIFNYCQSHNLPFWDFSEETLYKECGYEYAQDNQDAHPNVRGAQKITYYIGRILSNDYGITPMKDSQWEETREYYEGVERTFLEKVDPE